MSDHEANHSNPLGSDLNSPSVAFTPLTRFNGLFLSIQVKLCSYSWLF
jgi:hypothetical protein